MNIAKIYQSRGNISSARFWLNKAIAQGDGDAALELALLYLEKNRRDNMDKAIINLKLAVKSKRSTEAAREKARLILKQITT